MDTYARKWRFPPFNGERREFIVYNEGEALQRALVVEADWLTCEVGSWVRTADGYVLELLRRQPMTNAQKRYVLTFASHRVVARVGHGVPPYLPYRPYNPHGEVVWWAADAEDARRTRSQRALRAWATCYIQGGGRFRPKDWAVVGEALHPGRPKNILSAQKAFKNPHWQVLAMRKVRDVMVEMGLDSQTALQAYLDALEISREKGRADTMIEAADRILAIAERVEKETGTLTGWTSVSALPDRVEGFEPAAPQQLLEPHEAAEVIQSEQAQATRDRAARAGRDMAAKRRKKGGVTVYPPQILPAEVPDVAAPAPRSDF